SRLLPPGSFAADERGGITALGMFLIAASLLAGAYAIDWANAVAARTQLQVAADAAAHAALLSREFGTEPEAVAEAITVASLNMPPARYGEVLTAVDVEFGTWDAAAFAFTPQSGERGAVRVRTRRTADRGNLIATFLLRLVGIDALSAVREAVFVTYHPTCLREGFVAQEVVDLQSNNTYLNGFCVHSNAHVSLNSNNYFEAGTVVSMPDENDIDLPNSGFESNDGLADALREGAWHIRILTQLEFMIDGLESGDERYRPDYIAAGMPPIALTHRDIEQVDLVLGRIHTYSCTGGAPLTLKNGVQASEVVIVTDCKVKFEAGVVLTDTVIATRSLSAQSMTSAAGLRIGRDDNCATDGGTQLLTLG
ncbi:MAG: hypothetical protein H5U20_06380, partial [Rhodobacteraceae bacterium]|nr:hypothetical protein [Paracoccaceae bacterium]